MGSTSPQRGAFLSQAIGRLWWGGPLLSLVRQKSVRRPQPCCILGTMGLPTDGPCLGFRHSPLCFWRTGGGWWSQGPCVNVLRWKTGLPACPLPRAWSMRSANGTFLSSWLNLAMWMWWLPPAQGLCTWPRRWARQSWGFTETRHRFGRPVGRRWAKPMFWPHRHWTRREGCRLGSRRFWTQCVSLCCVGDGHLS